MKLTSISFQGVRGLANATYDLAPGGSPQSRVLVTGPPGAGLTSFLDAIAVTSARLSTHSAVPDSATVIHAGQAAATLRSRWWLEDAERRYAGLTDGNTDAEITFRLGSLGRVQADPGLLGIMSRYDHSGELAKVVYLPQRRVSQDSFSAMSNFEADQRRLQFSTEPSKFAGYPKRIIEDAATPLSKKLFEQVQSLFNAMCPTVRLSRIKGVDLEFTTGGGARVNLRQLSFSERSAFVLAAAPSLLALNNAVVLLDMPEVGAPRHLVARWLDLMSEQAPSAQWIVTTRSDELLSAASAANTITLANRA